MDISNIINNQNLFEKLSLSLVSINNYKMFEICYNGLSLLKNHIQQDSSYIYYPYECIGIDNIIFSNIKRKIID